MSVKAFYGFDGVGQGVQGTSGDAANAPLNGVGLLNTRNAALKNIVYSPGAPQYNAVGVTGLARHRVGKVSEKRNALILYRNVPANNITAGARVVLLEGFDARTSRSWRSVTGFTYVDFSDRNPGFGYALVSAVRNGSKLTLVQRRNDSTIQVGTVLYPIELGKEYYIEVEMFYELGEKPSSSNPISAQVRINGEIIGVWDKTLGSVPLNSGTVGLEVGFADHTTNAYPLHIGVADIYQIDGTGEAPWNAPIGPQRVSLKVPVDVDPGNFVIVGGAPDPVTALTDDSDVTGLESTLDAGTVDMLFDLDLNAGSIVNGLQVLGRVRRDGGATRPIEGDVTNSDLISPITVSGRDTFAEYVMAGILPSRTVEMGDLQGNVLSVLDVQLSVK